MMDSPLSMITLAFTLVMMVFSLSLHDLAQAWMANRLGDPTARMLGRMTMNPVPHFNLWGMVISPLLSIFWVHSPLPLAWTTPVPMTYRNFRQKNGETLAVLAGPAAQLAAALVGLVVLVLLKHFAPGGALALQATHYVAAIAAIGGLSSLPQIFPVVLLVYAMITMNLLLLCLNVLPFPFFDGGRLLENVLPYNAAKTLNELSTYLMIGFMFLAWPLTMFLFGPLKGVFDGLLARL